MNAGFQLSAYQAVPAIKGSVSDLGGMQFVYQGEPFFTTNQFPGFVYTMDSLGRLTQATLTNGSNQAIAYDAAGNRTSTSTTCGSHGC